MKEAILPRRQTCWMQRQSQYFCFTMETTLKNIPIQIQTAINKRQSKHASMGWVNFAGNKWRSRLWRIKKTLLLRRYWKVHFDRVISNVYMTLCLWYARFSALIKLTVYTCSHWNYHRSLEALTYLQVHPNHSLGHHGGHAGISWYRNEQPRTKFGSDTGRRFKRIGSVPGGCGWCLSV